MNTLKAILHHLQRLPLELFVLIVIPAAALLASITVKLGMILIKLLG